MGDRLAGWSSDARKVIERASREARGLNHEYVGSEHLLLALLESETGIASRLLSMRGVDKARVTREVKNLIPLGPPMQTSGPLPLTPRLLHVLKLARTEASIRGRDIIGSEHLLLALVADEGIGSQALLNCNLPLESMRNDILALLAADGSGADSAEARHYLAERLEEEARDHDNIAEELRARARDLRGQRG